MAVCWNFPIEFRVAGWIKLLPRLDNRLRLRLARKQEVAAIQRTPEMKVAKVSIWFKRGDDNELAQVLGFCARIWRTPRFWRVWRFRWAREQ